MDYLIEITTLLGADEATAKADMTAMLEFETTFANVSKNLKNSIIDNKFQIHCLP